MYAEAIAQDDEAAEFFLTLDTDGPPQRRVSDWTTEVQLLTKVNERLGLIAAAIISTGGGRPPTFPSEPRPDTAIARAMRRDRKRQHTELAARILTPEPE